MKKVLLGVSIVSLLLLTGCGDDHGNYDLKCTGNHIMTTEAVVKMSKSVSKDGKKSETTSSEMYIDPDKSDGEGEYYFYFEDDKIFVEYVETFNEKATKEYEDEFEDAVENMNKQGMNCSYSKNGGKATLTCKKHDETDEFKNYDTKEKIIKLMEDQLGYKCN